MRRELRLPLRVTLYGVAGCEAEGKNCRVVGQSSGTAVLGLFRSMSPSRSEFSSSVDDEAGDESGDDESANILVCFLASESVTSSSSSTVADEEDNIPSGVTRT